MVRDQDAWLCFADESGQLLRPLKARTWSRRGHTPRITVRGAGSGRLSLAVERTISWLSGYRRLSPRCERNSRNYLAFLGLVVAICCYKQLARLTT